MTPPAASPGASGSGSVDLRAETNLQAEGPQAPKEDPKPKKDLFDTNHPWALIPRLKVGLNWGSNGKPTGHLFDDSFGKYGDIFGFNVGGGLLTNANSGKAQVRFGGEFNFNRGMGDPLTFGSRWNQITLGLPLEVNFIKGWSKLFNGKDSVIPLANIGILAGVGYGWGHGTLGDGLLHKQGGLATLMQAHVNLVTFRPGERLNIGIDAAYTGTWIKGQQGNVPIQSFGPQIRFEIGNRGKKIVERETKVCLDTAQDIDWFVEEISTLRADSTSVEFDLDQLRAALETGSNPVTPEDIRDALFFREVRIALMDDLPEENEEGLRKAIKETIDAKKEGNETDEFILAIDGVTEDNLANAKSVGEGKYPVGYNFWNQVTLDPPRAEVPDPIPTDCDQRHDVEEALREEYRDVLSRNRDLHGRFDMAMVLDALKDALGQEVVQVVAVAKAMVLDVNNPNFRVDYPKKGQVDTLRSFVEQMESQGKTASLDELKPFIDGTVRKDGSKGSKPSSSHRVFEVPDFDLSTADQVAKMMRGETLPTTNKTGEGKLSPEDEKEVLEAMKSVNLHVEGHTSQEGKPETNQNLSERRAEFFQLMIRALGGDQARLTWKGYGEDFPLLEEQGLRGNAKLTSRIKNRRTVLRISGASNQPSAPTVDAHSEAHQGDRSEDQAGLEDSSIKPDEKAGKNPDKDKSKSPSKSPSKGKGGKDKDDQGAGPTIDLGDK